MAKVTLVAAVGCHKFVPEEEQVPDVLGTRWFVLQDLDVRFKWTSLKEREAEMAVILFSKL